MDEFFDIDKNELLRKVRESNKNIGLTTEKKEVANLVMKEFGDNIYNVYLEITAKADEERKAQIAMTSLDKSCYLFEDNDVIS